MRLGGRRAVRPVRTARSNMVYIGPTPDIGDLHCERVQPGVIASVWHPSAAERELIAKGANIKLRILGEPIPPTSLEVVDEPGIGEDASEILDRLDRWTNDQPKDETA